MVLVHHCPDDQHLEHSVNRLSHRHYRAYGTLCAADRRRHSVSHDRPLRAVCPFMLFRRHCKLLLEPFPSPMPRACSRGFGMARDGPPTWVTSRRSPCCSYFARCSLRRSFVGSNHSIPTSSTSSSCTKIYNFIGRSWKAIAFHPRESWTVRMHGGRWVIIEMPA